MGKDRLEAEGRLEEVMDDLSVSANILKKTKDLIVQYIKQAVEEAIRKQQIEEARKRSIKQAEEASKRHQVGSKQATMETREASSNKKHKMQASKKKASK
jgi:hypothetical protein